MVEQLPEVLRGSGWRGTKGKNQDNYNSILNKMQF